MPGTETWTAFCTVHWFITGQRFVAQSDHDLTSDLYNWYRVNSDIRYLDITLNYEG